MNKRDRNREEQLTRLFASSGPESIPALEPDPGLPTRVRALARESDEAVRGRPAFRIRWAWAGLATAVCILAGGLGAYAGHRAAAAQLATEQISEADAFMMAWLQGGFVEDLSAVENGDEVSQ